VGDAPVVSLAEYAARVPRDPAQRQIVPVPARPFPRRCAIPTCCRPCRRPRLAERLWRALVLAVVALTAILLLA